MLDHTVAVLLRKRVSFIIRSDAVAIFSVPSVAN